MWRGQSLTEAGQKGALAACLTIGLLVPALGCGGLSAEQKAARREQEVAHLAAGVRTRERARERERARSAYERCQSQTGSLIDELVDLDTKLDSGLSFYDYTSEVDDLEAAYDGVPFSGLSSDCLGVGAASENSMNAYIRAYNVWNNCFNDLFCDTDSIDPNLQRKWNAAGDSLDRAQADLEAMSSPDPARVGRWSTAIPKAREDVSHSVYGVASRLLCSAQGSERAHDACEKLRDVLAGGVEEREIDALDEAVERLNQELGLSKPTKKL